MSTSKRYHHGDLRPAILQAAAKLLEKQGIGVLSLREVSRLAGVSHAAPYRHFPDRESLLAALAADGFAMLGEAQREAAAKEGLRGMGTAYVAFALDHPQRFRLMFGGHVAIGKHAALHEAARRTYEGLSGALTSRTGGAANARDASLAAWATVHGLAQLLMEDRIAPEAFAGRSREQFVRDVLGTMRFAAGASQPPA